MINFAVVGPDGDILRTGSCPADMLDDQAKPGQTVITHDGSLRDERDYVAAGGAIRQYPPKPGSWAVFDYVAEVWVDPRTPADLDAELAAARARMVLTFDQFLLGLEAIGWLSAAECDAWLDGTLPAPLVALINSLPAGQRFAARCRAKRPVFIRRDGQLVAAILNMTGKTDQQADSFFATYATA